VSYLQFGEPNRKTSAMRMFNHIFFVGSKSSDLVDGMLPDFSPTAGKE
jgi:hypothetical protein